MPRMGNERSIWQTLAVHTASDDQSLITGVLAGEPLACRALVDRYLPLIYSVCRRRGLARHDADDMTQTIVMRVLQALPRFRGEAKLSTWIFTLSQRAIADHYRHPHRREQTVDWSDSETAHALITQHTEPNNEAQRDADTITQYIDQLDEPVRSIMLRFYLADDSVADIAAAMALPEGTVKTYLFRGRNQLRQHLEISL
jgi:RNA polymerase sigma factor (sigma-70 family)